jgi:hypothetical protein
LAIAGDEMPNDDLAWVKSSYSIGAGACVELARDGDRILLRSSRHTDRHISYSIEEIRAFLAGARDHEFDSLLD